MSWERRTRGAAHGDRLDEQLAVCRRGAHAAVQERQHPSSRAEPLPRRRRRAVWASAPSPELEALRGAAVAKASKAGIDRKGRRCYALPADGICEICLTIDARTAPKVALTLANGIGEKAVAVYDAATRTMSFDRRESGLTDFSDAFAAVTVAPTREGRAARCGCVSSSTARRWNSSATRPLADDQPSCSPPKPGQQPEHQRSRRRQSPGERPW